MASHGEPPAPSSAGGARDTTTTAEAAGDGRGTAAAGDVAAWCGVALCTLVAAAYRVTLLATSYDVPGDGPSRAAIAHAWATARELPTCGSWPPGHALLAGAFHLLLPVPASARVLNVLLGTLSVPLLYVAAARTWRDRRVALLAAAALAILPLHAELSATSLTEVPFTCALLVAWWMLLLATPVTVSGRSGATSFGDAGERGRARAGGRAAHGAALLAAGGALSLAQALRYEGWLFAPVVVAWWLWRTRAVRETALLAALVLWFPLAWTAGNAHCRDPWMGFRAALGELAVPTGDTPLAKLLFAARVVRDELGVLATLVVVAGAASELAAVLRARASSARVLALALAGTAWAVLGASVAARGASVWTRYFLPALVLALPFAAASLRLVRGGARIRRGVLLAAAAVVLGILVPDLVGRRPRHWLRAEPPRAAADLAAWLAADPGRARLPIVTTPVGWELTFLPVLAPDTYWHLRTCSSWIAPSELDRWVDELRRAGPFVLVTRDGDEADLARLERAAGGRLTADAPVLRTHGLRVYLARIASPGDADRSAPGES